MATPVMRHVDRRELPSTSAETTATRLDIGSLFIDLLCESALALSSLNQIIFHARQLNERCDCTHILAAEIGTCIMEGNWRNLGRLLAEETQTRHLEKARCPLRA